MCKTNTNDKAKTLGATLAEQKRKLQEWNNNKFDKEPKI